MFLKLINLWCIANHAAIRADSELVAGCVENANDCTAKDDVVFQILIAQAEAVAATMTGRTMEAVGEYHVTRLVTQPAKGFQNNDTSFRRD